MSTLRRTIRPTLFYHGDQVHTRIRTGFWVRGCSARECVTLMLDSDKSASAPVNYYILPCDGNPTGPDDESVDLLALPAGDESLQTSGNTIPVVEELKLSTGQSLWRTIESRLEPKLSIQQWANVLPAAAQGQNEQDPLRQTSSGVAEGIADAWIWLPHRGLVILEAADRITMIDLLRRPAGIAKCADWKQPPQPAVLPERIAGFEAWVTNENEPPLSDLSGEFGQRAGELGKSNLGFDGLPIDDKNTMGNLKKKGQAWLLKFLDNILSQKDGPANNTGDKQKNPPKLGSASSPAQHGAKRSSLFKGLSLGLYQQLSKAVEGQREQQLKKLLSMTKSNPDEALKFAIPLGGDSLFRGLSIPGASLLARLPQYAFGNGGSGPADFWQIDSRLQSELRRSYLDMANREVAAGRFRRAAYIYANLLNDQSAAAAVLEQGGFFREAAQIYGEKLRQKKDQARCLMSAGLHEQAVELFLQNNDFLAAAEAWESAGRPEDARREYQRAVQKLVTEGKILTAADLLVDKLDAREEAMELLWSQWPNGSDVVSSTLRYFKMLANDQETELASQRLEQAIESSNNSQALTLADLCQQLATSYPDKQIQAAAHDACRVAIAARAPQMSSIEIERSMLMLGQLDAADQLLRRDAEQFKRHWSLRNRSQRKPTRLQQNKDSIRRRVPLLLSENNCVAFNRVGESLVVTSENAGQLTVSRYLSPAHCPSLKRDVDVLVGTKKEPDIRTFALKSLHAANGDRSEKDFSFEAFTVKDVVVSNKHSSAGLVYWLDGTPRNTLNQVLYEGRAFPQSVTVSNQIPTALRDCIAVCQIGEDWAGIVNEGYEWSLRICSRLSTDLRTWTLTQFSETFVPQSFEVTVSTGIATNDFALLKILNGMTVTAFENYLVAGIETETPWSTRVSSQIIDVTTSPANTRKRIAVAHSSGLDAIWLGESGKHITVANDRPFQKVLWMQGGRLFGLADDWLFRYQFIDDRIVSEASIRLLPDTVVDLIELSAGVCGVCYQCGVVDRF